MDASARPIDVVLFGATGFTGRLVAEALLRTPEARSTLRVALAGRNREKLSRVHGELLAAVGADSSTFGDRLTLEVVDAADATALNALAARTKVVCTTVGPYLEHGGPLVAACAENGTHYCDLTGEPPFIRRCIDRHDAQAKASGARIVHCCGFDSIPSDLGTLLLQTTARDDGGACDRLTMTLGRMRGGFSGGTAHSLLGVLKAASEDRAVRKVMSDPYSLCPEQTTRGPDRERFSVRYDDDVGGYVGPFLMGPINARVVRRSNLLQDFAYGAQFSYAEQHRMGRGLKGRAMANGLRAGLVAMMGLGVQPLGRRFLEKVLPAPGEGPDEKARETGFFELHFHGRRSADGAHYRGFVRGEKDPGYAGTAIMLSQAALALVDGPQGPAGVTTPAAAIGLPLIERLRAAGMTFTAERV